MRVGRDWLAGRTTHGLTTDACLSNGDPAKPVLPSDQPVPGTYPLVRGFAPGAEVLGALTTYGPGGTPAHSTKERVRSRRWTCSCVCVCVCV